MPLNLNELTKTQPDFLIDTNAINARLREEENYVGRIHVGTFALPLDMSPGMVKAKSFEKARQFIEVKEKDGWRLIGKPSITGPHKAHDEYGNIDENSREFWVKGMFRHMKSLVRTRIELPPSMIKQDPEHHVTLKDIIGSTSYAGR